MPRPPYGAADPFARYIMPRLAAIAVVVFAFVILASTSTYVVAPGTRGVKITLGKTETKFLPEGFGFRTPFITRVEPVNVKQRTRSVTAACFSSDMQQVQLELNVLFRVPQESVVQIYRDFAGDPFESLISPRVQEAVKEVTALLTAEQIVKKREEIKDKTMAAARTKIGSMLMVEDIVIKNLDLSNELERAIEAKMVAEQQAVQAKFTQIQTQTEAETAVIRARGEADAIRARGEALKLNPEFVRLQIVERWNGKSPLVVPSAPGAGPSELLLPLGAPPKLPAP
jgi:prohibitin 2